MQFNFFYFYSSSEKNMFITSTNFIKAKIDFDIYL